jgi:hypothetical protein
LEAFHWDQSTRLWIWRWSIFRVCSFWNNFQLSFSFKFPSSLLNDVSSVNTAVLEPDTNVNYSICFDRWSWHMQEIYGWDLKLSHELRL